MPLELSNNSEYTSIKEVKNLFTVKLNKLLIIEVEWHPSNSEIKKEHLVLLKEAIKELGGGKKMPILINSSDFLGITKEARNYATLPEASEYTLGNAVLIKSLANKILFNFFMNIHKPNVATKAFTNNDEAVEWLTGLK